MDIKDLRIGSSVERDGVVHEIEFFGNVAGRHTYRPKGIDQWFYVYNAKPMPLNKMKKETPEEFIDSFKDVYDLIEFQVDLRSQGIELVVIPTTNHYMAFSKYFNGSIIVKELIDVPEKEGKMIKYYDTYEEALRDITLKTLIKLKTK
jgi:hypothetical protein